MFLRKKFFLLFLLIYFGKTGLSQSNTIAPIISYTVNPKTQELRLFWKDDKGEILKSIQSLNNYASGKSLLLKFAMNGGMYKRDHSPQGLFILSQELITPLNTHSGSGNFYLKPNGVFYLTDDKRPVVCKTSDFVDNGKIAYATQSGPMLLINGEIHPAFKKGSANLNIRNGVGILPDNRVVFAISKSEINFYDFALFFKNIGCKNALYLDGFVSRMYLPEKNWKQTDGDFGVMIGVVDFIDE